MFAGKIACVMLGTCGLLAAQTPGAAVGEKIPPQAAPAPVLDAAVAAVGQLGKQVEAGRYEYAIQRMFPMWKERMASRMGGEAELEKQLAAASQEMTRQGVRITSFQPQGQPRSYEVGIGKKVETVGGKPVESLIYTKWLVLVPTLTRFSIPPGGSYPKGLQIESTGFQAAISDKGKNDWTFIDGSGLNTGELRKLFVNLPQDLELPPVAKKDTTPAK